jgi:uncharacterized protein (TIGR04141 family)
VLRTQPARFDLVFVENIVPVTSVTTCARLDEQLELMLAAGPGTGEGLSVAVPVQVLDQLPQARLFRVKIGGAAPRGVVEVRLDDILGRPWLQPDGRRVEALRAGWIEMFSSSDGRGPLARTSALRWIEASASLSARKFVLLDGEWYELGAGYLAQLRQDVERLLTCSSGVVSLPGWKRKADGKYEEEKDFADLVRRHGHGRTVPEDFTPTKIVFGILLKDGEDLTVDTLSPFAQVALRQAAFDLEGRVEIEAVGIRVG